MTVVNDGLAEIARLIGSGLGGTQFGAMAIGSSSTAATVLNRRLGDELTNTNGGGRKASAGVTKTLPTSSSMRWSVAWAFSGVENVREFCVANSDTADADHAGNTDGGPPTAGITLLRDVFASVFTTQSADTLTLTVDVVIDDKTASTSQVITNAALTAMTQLILAGQTGTAFTHTAMGSSTTAAAATQTTLSAEFTTLGLSRAASTVTNVTTTVTNDTTQFDRQFSVTGNAGVNETGIFNAASAGTMLCRFVYASQLNLINTDTFTQRVKIVHVAS